MEILLSSTTVAEVFIETLLLLLMEIADKVLIRLWPL